MGASYLLNPTDSWSMTAIPYHLDAGGDVVLSLEWVNSDPENVFDVERQKRASVTEPLIEYRSRVEHYEELGLHCLYEAELHQPDDEHWSELSELSTREKLIADTLIDAFLQIERERENDGVPLLWYKTPDIESIIAAIDQIQFRQSIPEVGGQILSNIITEHPLPNANHRAAISFLETYLQSFDHEFTMPQTGVIGEWKDWAADFVHESKKLMMLGRKGQLLSQVKQCGCERVIRDGGHLIELDKYQLDVPNPFERYAGEVHQEQSRGFVYGILERTESSHLIGEQDQGKSTFVDRLAASGQASGRASLRSS